MPVRVAGVGAFPAHNVMGSIAGAIGVLRRPLPPDLLIEWACARTGFSDFGEFPFMGFLRQFLLSCTEEAALNLIGRISVSTEVLRLLTNLLRLRAAERRLPAIAREPIEKPIIVTGLPRSGTTFLHHLLMCDPDNRAPRTWQTAYPYPGDRIDRAEPPEASRDRRIQRVERELRAFRWLAPEFQDLHPITAESPQECCEITGHLFQSVRLSDMYHVPGYEQLRQREDRRSAHRFQKRFLQHLQYQQAPGRWVLKCPDHLFALADLRAVFPDACFVFLHRDPVKGLLSGAKLGEVMRRPFTRRLDRFEIGRNVSRYWRDGVARMVQADAGGSTPQVCHVQFRALTADPVGTVRSVYERFGLAVTPRFDAAVRKLAGERPNGGYFRKRTYRYRFEEYGLDAGAQRDLFRAYMAHFAVDPE